jgi:fatty-acyl-CoA synthase
MDDEGYCNIVGRIKDMVIRGGENIYRERLRSSRTATNPYSDVQVFGVPGSAAREEPAPDSSCAPAKP